MEQIYEESNEEESQLVESMVKKGDKSSIFLEKSVIIITIKSG